MRVLLILFFRPMTECLNETIIFRAFNLCWRTPVHGELTIVYWELSYHFLDKLQIITVATKVFLKLNKGKVSVAPIGHSNNYLSIWIAQFMIIQTLSFSFSQIASFYMLFLSSISILILFSGVWILPFYCVQYIKAGLLWKTLSWIRIGSAILMA